MSKVVQDSDLQFLYKCSNEQLQLLADFMLYGKDGKQRITEELSMTASFRKNYPNNMRELVPDMIKELQLFGGNTFLNKFRGHGVPYRNILEDVCKMLKVPFAKGIPTELLEEYLLRSFLVMTVDKMTEEDVHHLSSNLTKEAFKRSIRYLEVTSPLFIKLITMVVVNIATKYGLKQAAIWGAKFAGGRFFAILAGPIGWIISSIWTAFDIAGPAYRVTIPCTITIAYLRIIYSKSDEELNAILK